MKQSIKLWAAGLVGGCSLLLASCIQMEQKVILNPDNSGKVRVTMEMPNPMAMMGGALGDLGGAEADGPSPDDMAADIAKGILGGATGVDAWKDVEWGATAEGKMRFQGVAYFKDINNFEAGSDSAGEGASGGTLVSEMRDGKWVITMSMEEEGAEDEPAAAGEPVPADQIDAALAEQRQQWQAMKGMMAGFFNDMKFEHRLKVAGEIESVNNFEQHGPNVAGVTVDGAKILNAMETMLMDDEFMKKALAEGNVGEDGMPEPPPEMAGLMMFGNDGPIEIVINPGEPLFDYDSEVAAAQAAMSDELKQMIEEGKAMAEEGGDDIDISF